GKGRIMAVPLELGGIKPGMERAAQRDKALEFVAQLAESNYRPATGLPKDAPSYGTMCLACTTANAASWPVWTDRNALYREFVERGRPATQPATAGGPQASPPSPAG